LIEANVCSVVFPDGSEALCANRVFPGLRQDYPVIAYPEGDSRWSLHDPAWILPFHGDWTLSQLANVLSRRSGEEGEPDGALLKSLRQSAGELFPGLSLGEQTTLDEQQCRQMLEAVSDRLKPTQQRAVQQCLKGYTCGDPVPFRITHADATDPAILHGTLLGEPAYTRREELPFPKCLPLYPVELLTQDTSFAWHLVDPASYPLRIARCLTGSLEYPTMIGQRHQKHPEPGLFLLALRALTQQRPTLPAVVRMADEEFVSLDIYGARLAVFPEQCRWHPEHRASDLYHEGQTVEVYLTVDAETFTIDTSLLSIDGPEWKQVVEEFPPGELIRDAQYLLSNREGLVVDVPCGQLQLRGLIPFGELAEGNDPYSYYTDELDGPLTLRVIAPDPERRRLIMSWRKGMPQTWCGARLRPGQLVPVEVVVALPDAIWVRWAPGQLAEISGDEPRKGCWWARVETIDYVERSLALSLHQPEEPFEVLAVGEDTVLARLGESEITLFRRPPFENVQPGQLIQPHVRSIVHRYSGPTIVAASANAYLELSKLEEGTIRHAIVQERVKGGFQVDMEGLRGFLPSSQVDVRQPRDMNAIVGLECDVVVLKVDPLRSNIVVSRRQLLEQEREKQKEQLLREIAPGQVRLGVVKNIADYGAFIDLGGIDGLLHITDMAWHRVSDPRKLVQEGQKLNVYVVSVDRKKEKIAVGLKQLGANPWEDIETKYPVGSRHEVEVANVVAYGAFVELEPGIEGLVHTSEMSWTRRVTHAKEVVAIGDRVQVQVLLINREKQEISLGMKQVQPNPWDRVAEKYPAGSVVTGTVRNLTNYGAFIEIEDGIDGLLHVSDMSHVLKVAHPTEVVEKGQILICLVLSVDAEKKRLALGLKQLQPDPWERDIPQRYQVDAVIKGKVSKLTNFGVFVEVEPGLEGLLHNSELSEAEAENTEELVKVGSIIDVKVLRVDPVERKIGLSRKAVLAAVPPIESAPVETLPPPPVVETPPAEFHSTIAPSDDTLLPEMKPASAAVRATAPRTESDDNLDAWLVSRSRGSELIGELEQQKLHAAAEMVRAVEGQNQEEKTPWQPLPGWSALGRLLDLGYGAGTPVPLTAAGLDVVLRLLIANPAELFLYESLAEMLPPAFIDRYYEELQRWLNRHGVAREDCRIGLGILRTRGLQQLTRFADAFAILNPIASEDFDNSLVAERNLLVKRFDEKLRGQSIFTFRDGVFERDRSPGMKIADGSFAFVIPVRERATGKTFALKHYRLQHFSPEDMELALDLFTAEAIFLRRVHEVKPHPNVIRLEKILDRGVILLEWFPGVNLGPGEGGVRQEGTWWNLERVLDLGYRVASAFEAVAHVHGKQSGHNDLHPGNLMVDPRAYPAEHWVKVIDFGLSTEPRYYSMRAVIDRMGTKLRWAYRAPEMATGDSVAPASDVFALGVILFQLLTGKFPLSKPDDDPEDRDRAPLGLVDEVAPQSVGQLLASMLQQRPQDRPGDWKIVKESLARHLNR
jgi:small subunit ribosomal protein S1